MDISRYEAALRKIPAPGGGCHPALLGCANLGVKAGLSPEQIFADIRAAIPEGKRRIYDREITDTVDKALSDHNGKTFTPRPRPTPVVQDGPTVLQKIINQGQIVNEVDLREASPIRLWDEPQNDPVLLLETIFKSDDLLFIGDRRHAGIIGDTIRTAHDWKNYFKNGGKTSPHIILNPLNGTAALTKTGDKQTFRGDNNVASYRYCLAEFDTLPV
jgi:hypothetical protein